jgi:DNA topoisomerase-1
VRVRIGRYGPFLQLGDTSDDAPRASVPDDLGPADLTLDEALKLLKAKAEGPRTLGVDPKTALPVYVMHGRFGPYVQLGEHPEKGRKDKPKRASLEPGMSEDGVSLAAALRLLSLPRELGAADAGETILANRGRFGPYVQQGSEYRSLEADDDVYTITLARAKELLAKPKGQRRQRAAAKELRALGAHPTGGAPVRILDGRYGPYVTDGTTNASLPKGTPPDALTMEQAVELMNARAGSASAKRRGTTRRGARGRSAAKVSTATAVETATPPKTAKPAASKRTTKR